MTANLSLFVKMVTISHHVIVYHGIINDGAPSVLYFDDTLIIGHLCGGVIHI